MRSWSGRYGRSKVVEVFRLLRDGDPVEIGKNFRCSSDNLVVSSMSTGITCGRQGDVNSLCKGDYAKRFSPAPSTLCGDGQWSAMQTLCLHTIGTEKNPLELRLRSVVQTI